MKTRLLRRVLLLAPLFALMAPGRAAAPSVLWQLGRPDRTTAEFALAPNRFHEFGADAFFVVGRSEAKRDWPYAHPGPDDTWAGGRPHTFTVVFGLNAAPPSGACRLRLDLVDTHRSAPPQFRVAVNGTPIQAAPDRALFQLPAGAGDDSISGQPDRGRPYQLEIAFPTTLLQPGENQVSLTSVRGSWFLYDALALETPAGAELAPVAGRTFVDAVSSPPVLVEQDGALCQTVVLSVRHLADEAEAVVRVAGVAPIRLHLRPGAQRLEVPVPAVEQATSVDVTVTVGDRTLAAQTVALKPVRQWVVYLLPHSHVDIGYTHVQTEVEQAQWRYLEMAMEAARKSAGNPPGSRFKWNVEVLWAVDSYLRQATPAKQAAFFDAVKAGQIGLQALYGNELTGLCRPEELLRLVGFAQTLSRRAGVPIESAMITDVPGYTWGLVPAFAHSGIKYFSIGPNGGDRIGHTIAAWGDKPFWWLGPNGRDKVLVWMTGTGYYRVFSSPDNLLNYLGQLDASGYPYDFVQVRHCLGDNGAPDVDFAETVKQWNATHAYPRLVIATTEDMFRDFEQRYGDAIPTARGDFTPYWEDGAASSARETALNRASADRLTQAEALFALFSPKAYPAEAFYQAWRDVVLYDEHTWGAHNSISQPDAPFVHSQWAIKQAFALDADRHSRALLGAANAARGAAPGPTPHLQPIDVINTTSAGHPYALVVVPKELAGAGDNVCASPTNRVGPVPQRLTTGELVFRPCVTGYSAARWYVTDDPPATPHAQFPGARAEGVTLTSARSAVAQAIALRLDETTGAIASLRYDGHELVDPNAPTALNDYFYLPGSDLKGLERNGPVRISVKETGPLIASLLVESDAPGCDGLTREYRLHALRNYVEIINTVDKRAVRAKEGVHFGFGFNVPGGVVRLDVPWAVVRPETDQLAGACKNWFTVQRYVDISNDRVGVTWLTPDAPLVEVGGITANLIGGLSGSKLWLEHLAPSQTIYSWAMNNHWHTNYRAEQEGPTVFRYVIVPHEAGAGAEVSRRAAAVALELSQPLLVLPARGPAPTHPPLLRVQGGQGSARVQVTAFKPSDDGQARIVRLFGVSDRTEKVELEWTGPPPRRVWLSDASERPREPVQGAVEVPPFTIVTLRADLP